MTGTDGIRMRSAELARYAKITWVLVAAGILLAAVAAAQIAVRMYDDYRDDGVLVTLAAAQVLCGLGLAVAGFLNRHVLRTAHIRLTPQGVINRQLRDELIPWRSITAIETVPRGRAWRVRLTLDGGRRRTLVVPLTRRSAPDPQFAADRDVLVAWWRQHA